MEQLIIFAIIAIVSSLFSKSKNKDRQQMPPFNKDAKPQSPVLMDTEEQKTERPAMNTHSFEDFARKFLGDVQDEQPEKNLSKEYMQPAEIEVVEQTSSDVAPPPIRTDVPHRNKERQSYGRIGAGKKEVRVTSSNQTFALPTSNRALMQAVVMAEVLGPPKAKRK